MNLPNKLTIFRIVMVPIFVILLEIDLGLPAGLADILALIVFIVASFTDFLDGHIARKRNLVTNFGKFMDPLADKLLVCSACICLTAMGRIPAWVVVIIIGREFVISGFRLVASEAGIVIAAGIWGKAKTVTQMAMTIALLLHFEARWWTIFEQVLIFASVALSIISVIDYIYTNRQVLKGGN
ncbi:MAG: CDP-diacylglycerol--glycerol-3-phosphate 3-phosphatidyltransferase [Lachnospiraceae bacterium]|nr:CDP-diacylglycerol--glycerol-3-phosphate 3-phosphatidyltransferase [Candidatus Minthocola equi]